MDCPKCGVHNPEGKERCRICGAWLEEEPSTSSGEDERTRKAQTDTGTSVSLSGNAGLGGMMVFIAALFGFVDALATLLIGMGVADLPEYDRLVSDYPQLEGLFESIAVCQIVRLVFISIAMMGAWFALHRLRWGLSLLGAVLGLAAISPSYLALMVPFWLPALVVPWILSLVGIILIAMAHKEFEHW